MSEKNTIYTKSDNRCGIKQERKKLHGWNASAYGANIRRYILEAFSLTLEEQSGKIQYEYMGIIKYPIAVSFIYWKK